MPDYHNVPYTRYNPAGSYEPGWSEDIFWKLQYSRIDFDKKSFEYLKKKLMKLDIPDEKIQDLIDELDIIVNNAGKMKLERSEIGWLLDEFDKLWHNFCIYTLSNSRWIDELNHVRAYAEYVLLQEFHKSIDGWQGDNLLRTKVEQTQRYDVRQEAFQTETRRGWFRNKKRTKRVSPAQQGFNVSQQPQQQSSSGGQG